MTVEKGARGLHQLISDKECEDLGILPVSWSDNDVVLGAMNPEMGEIEEIRKRINTQTGMQVKTIQITCEEWEKWFESGDDSFKLNDIPRSEEGKKNGFQRLEEGFEEAAKSAVAIGSQDQTGSDEVAPRPIEERKEEALLSFEEIEAEYDDDDEGYGKAEGDSDLHSSDGVVKAVANILYRCESLKASDIHIEPQEANLRVRYRVDGILQKEYEISKKLASGIVARTKILARLDVAEKRLPQDGRIRVRFDGEDHDFRVSTLPGKHGEKIVLRALRSDNSILDLGKLVNETKELDLIRELCDNPYGIFIVVGPTGSGKSTTLYSILSEHNDPGINISTVEDPIEYTLPGLHQVQVVREKGLDFARALRALMRQDPDVILVGETRDRETAQVAMEAALTGHMVFTTLHANDTSTAISRLSEMGVPPYLIGASVVGVMAQRLMRRVCTECSTLVPADAENKLLRKFNISEHRQATVRIGGMHQTEIAVCAKCKGSGYKGRVGVYEVLRIDDDIRHAVLMEKSADETREVSRLKGMRTLLEYGMEMVRKGLSTIEEVERVCMLEKDEESVEGEMPVEISET